MNKYENVSNGLSVLTGSIALANIQDILSIIILVLSVANILFNMFIRIYKHIKAKRLDLISSDLQDASTDLEKLKEKEGNENE